MSAKRIAIVGASGVVGRALLECLQREGEEVVGLSRRKPADLTANFVSLDLTDQKQCMEITSSTLANVTHLVYAALYEKPGLIDGWKEADQMETNLQMLKNILEPLKKTAKLRHITLLQGTKAYGAHVGRMKIPGREKDPRHPHENFYWLQQDYLADFCKNSGASSTIWRPQIIFGHALNAPMNMLNAIGVYASIMNSRGQPLVYPGGPSSVTEAVDADLLANAIRFSFDNTDFENEIFNITNGDVFGWQDIWSDLAGLFHMQTGESSQQRLSDWIYEAEEEWQRIVTNNNLKSYSIREIAGDSFFYADALLNADTKYAPPPALVSTIKLRRTGFTECMDTLDMFEKWFKKLRLLKIIPT